MEEQAQRKYGLYTPTSEGDDDFPSIPGMIARYSALSLTNEQMAENPVWKDLTGNGYDLQMKNFAWSGMSGVDGYEYNFLSSDWVVGKVQLSEALSYKITIVDKKNSVQLFKYIRNESENTIKITLITLNKDWTIVGNWTMLSNIPSNCGIIKVSSVFLYNSLDGVTIYFAGGPIKIQSKSINAFCSDGRVYLNDWTEILKPDAQIASGGIKSGLNIASYSANFTKMAFKNLAIYDGKNLSKDDCIKAYNYLQTLKAK